ncbi:FkbM family methyltransferase [Ancylobacter sp. IITR112]|uniref:FkbM family methyltransferase n=1 Tax=Ancylobacter sp. IITR112 TaxID=3138073 RepID=UPI00352B4BA5
MAFVSFAQNYEDVMLWRALAHVGRGFYVDVGAFSPDVDSVTRAFYERGWRGVNIEPMPERLAELEAKRPGDLNLGVAASDGEGTARLHIIGDSGLTTVDPALAELHRAQGWAVSVIDVPRRRLTELLDAHLAPDQTIHFLKIDVEGHETAVVRGLDLARYRPWLIVIETTRPNSPEETSRDWEGLLIAAGYRRVYWDGLNRFYLAGEHAALAAAFSAPPNVFDDFVKHDGQVDALERLLADERATSRDAAARLKQLERQIDELRAQLAQQTSPPGAGTAPPMRRPAWEKLLFRKSGRPTKMLRRLLFHTSGKPRGSFRWVIFHANGRPRRPFQRWLASEEYQGLPGAWVGSPGSGASWEPDASPGSAPHLSPAAALLSRRIAARRAIAPTEG